MTCSTPGCYAKTFRKNLCRNHFYMWSSQLPATAPRKRERELRATPAPPRWGVPTYAGPCRCETPRPYRIPWFGCYECLNCGMPLPTERIAS